MSLATLLSKLSPISIPSYYTTFTPGQTPFSTYTSVTTTLALYFATIFGTQHLLRDRKPIQLNSLFRLHNIVLSVGSGLLLALTVEEVVPFIWKRGLFAAICNQDAYTPRLEAYYIVNYWFKYVELIDTVFLALKKKDLKFLHVFHHSATAALCFVQLQERTPLSWMIMSINLMVHVLMYYYYYATAGGAKIWWKKYLTSMQIIQFIIDLGVSFFGIYTEAAFRWAPSLPHYGHCQATERAAITGCSLIAGYLFLFIQFYIQTYKPQKPSAVPAAPAPKSPKLAGSRKAKQRAGRTHKRATSSVSMAARVPSSH